MLTGNYLKAKTYFRECLKKDPNPAIKGMVLNNLALAYYWQKFSTLDDAERVKSFQKDSDDAIEKEFRTVVILFKDAIRALESTVRTHPDVDSQEETADKLFFARLLSHETKGVSHVKVAFINAKELQNMAYLNNSLSAYPILNIADFLLSTDKANSHSVGDYNLVR